MMAWKLLAEDVIGLALVLVPMSAAKSAGVAQPHLFLSTPVSISPQKPPSFETAALHLTVETGALSYGQGVRYVNKQHKYQCLY